MKQIVTLLLLVSSMSIFAQKTIQIRVSNANDDLEEFIPGSNQTKPLGSMDAGSSDLELGSESANNKDPQLVGIRFVGIQIPKNALITKAYIQFTVDATSKNSDPSELYIYAENADNPRTFSPDTLFNLSSRSKINDSIFWKIQDASWKTAGVAGQDQRTSDLSRLVQALVNREGWNVGNSMAFYIKGKGTREAESADDEASKAPLLVIEYIVPVTISSRVASANDDLEEYIPGPNQTKTLGSMDAGSSDLELGSESANNKDPQLVGVRFTNLNIPPNAVIQDARIQFTVDATSKNSDPSELYVYIQDAENPGTFNPDSLFNISKRIVIKDSIFWKIPDASWKTAGQAGIDQLTPNLSKLVQTIVNKPNWKAGNAMVFLLKGIGTREAESADDEVTKAPLFTVKFIPVNAITTIVSSPNDDIEEYIAGANQTKTLGTMDAGSSDLELGSESANNKDPQLVGIRFASVKVDKSKALKSAYIQFTTDATSKNSDPSELHIYAQDADNPITFYPDSLFNVSKRPQLKDSIFWKIPNGTWKTAAEAGPDQRTPNLLPLIQSLIQRDGWKSGNAMAFFIKGIGTREAESADDEVTKAPKLIIEYFESEIDSLPTGNSLSVFPIKKGESWSYAPGSASLDSVWFSPNFIDSNWSFGKAPLGFGEKEIVTTLTKNPGNTLFRKKVSIASASSLSDVYEFHLRADDGAVVYVNGKEQFRTNMPSSNVIFSTLSARKVEGNEELPYYLFEVSKSAFKEGENLIAVSLHSSSANDDDLFFDLFITPRVFKTNAPALGCLDPNDGHISCFTSVIPRIQNDTLQIPERSHVFQYVSVEGDPYNKGTGALGSNFDFTGYVPKNGSSKEGYLSINHETDPGGVSMLNIRYDESVGLWKVDSAQAIDFSSVGGTIRNCSGTVTPWNTIVTCEEDYGKNSDGNGDGYFDIGWCTEIDPITKKIKDYGTGKPQKLWALGRISHENVVVDPIDKKTVYFGEDEGDGAVYKFIADKAGDLSAGKLYTLVLDSVYTGGDYKGSTGKWVVVPNTTIAERNDTKKLTLALGATKFAGVEDVEISPLNQFIYFAVKGAGRVYRFKDNGSVISNFETFLGGLNYRVNVGSQVVSESFGSGIDNLAFDERGNLYALQDGGNNYVWMATAKHSQAAPQVEVFMNTPIGSEPTGITFTPDHKFMFISIQEPNTTVKQSDVAKRSVTQNLSYALAIARTANLGQGRSTSVNELPALAPDFQLFPNPASDFVSASIYLKENANLQLQVFDTQGRLVLMRNLGKQTSGDYRIEFDTANLMNGIYFVKVNADAMSSILKLVVNH